MAEKKINYYSGQMLTAEDFSLAQNYLKNIRADHFKNLHSWGIYSGFDVTQDPGHPLRLIVGAGYAVNSNNDILELDTPVTLDFSAEPSGSTMPGLYIYYITASYTTSLTDSAPSSLPQGYTRVTEGLDIAFSPDPPANPDIDLILATATFTFDEAAILNFNFVDTSVRTVPFINTGTLHSDTLQLKISGQPENNWPALNVSRPASLQTLSVTAEVVDLGGDLNLGGNLALSGNLYTPGTLDVTGTVTFQNNVNITGNLTAAGGPAEAVEAGDLSVTDALIRLNDYPPASSPLPVNGGLEVYRGGDTPNYPNAQLLWDETATQWKFGLADSLNTSIDTSGNAILNSVYTGDLPGGTGDKAIFAHKNMATAAGYALMQDDTTGVTSLNAASGGTVRFKIGEPPDPQANPHGNDVFKVTQDQTVLTGQINQTDTWTVPTLSNGWVTYNTSYHEAGYFKDKRGIVYLRGLIKSGTINTTLFTLPAGYRPEFLMNFAIIVYASALGKLNITTGGVVTITHGNSTWVSLDGVRFRAFY